mmetsp:Transcript_3417/g.7749  ORF Transcript_3417/g.7749 Transcript_3417/m.7749 type:complete len:203 (+) Transcript_3417:380-988(+)
MPLAVAWAPGTAAPAWSACRAGGPGNSHRDLRDSGDMERDRGRRGPDSDPGRRRLAWEQPCPAHQRQPPPCPSPTSPQVFRTGSSRILCGARGTGTPAPAPAPVPVPAAAGRVSALGTLAVPVAAPPVIGIPVPGTLGMAVVLCTLEIHCTPVPAPAPATVPDIPAAPAVPAVPVPDTPVPVLVPVPVIPADPGPMAPYPYR